MNISQAAEPVPLTEEMLRRLDVAGPRYTSYPTADRFVEAFGEADLRRALLARGGAGGASVGGTFGGSAPLSIYVHVPFCESVCYYCACNKVITRHHERATPYLAALEREMDLYAGLLGGGAAGRRPAVSQLHLGGGTPTFLSDGELEQLVAAIRTRFTLLPGAELSIEVDPRTVDGARLQRLAALGFNRLSLGVQDFDPAVQRAVHRVQSHDSVAALLQAARKCGFVSTNIDLIYGLPLQSPASLARTVAQVAALRPDRIALYAYAHLPERFKPQRRIDIAQMPTAEDRLGMISRAMSGFVEAGYSYIGMDHFALPDDSLAVARRQGRLHRNFQGYSTQPDSDLLGLGVSAISRVGATYSQNAKTLPEYYDAVENDRLPVVRGLALNRDDLLRRAVIMALMCQGRLDFEAIEMAYLIDVPSYFATELARMQPLVDSGLVVREAGGLSVTPLGWYFVRAVAMVFDRYLQSDRARGRYSRII